MHIGRRTKPDSSLTKSYKSINSKHITKKKEKGNSIVPLIVKTSNLYIYLRYIKTMTLQEHMSALHRFFSHFLTFFVNFPHFFMMLWLYYFYYHNSITLKQE